MVPAGIYDCAVPPVTAAEKKGEAYTARVIYEDGEAVTVGTVSARCQTIAAYTANVATVLATAMGGSAVHATDTDSFSAVVRCHAANGEVYTVTVGRKAVTVHSYSADAILAIVEAWNDAVPALIQAGAVCIDL